MTSRIEIRSVTHCTIGSNDIKLDINLLLGFFNNLRVLQHIAHYVQFSIYLFIYLFIIFFIFAGK